MDQLDAVFRHYRRPDRPARIPGANISPDLLALREELPALFAAEIGAAELKVGDYRIAPSGEPNRSFPRIPWVGAFRKDVTRSATKGYYIVLLFREDLQGAYLSLNQGYTQFKEHFESQAVATRQVQESARNALRYVAPPHGFIRGPIDLAATGDLGQGYEAGAIVSRYYSARADIDEADFRTDFRTLLQLYEELVRRIGRNLVDALPPLPDEDFQEAAAAFAEGRAIRPYVPPPPGPVAPPSRRSGGGRAGGYQRSPSTSGAALLAAGFKCELDPNHRTFVSNSTRRNFVEAHHLIPMQFQEQFSASLDVLENIVALCPTCHRMLHHARRGERANALTSLLAARVAGLTGRGLTIETRELIELYKAEIVDE
ncbi:MrcB family domain-containing protein [Arenibaculum pallidiluteum]|uniref:MrcB family domain-containing protein n=1 Tax=Arenibaculum pallidiluteum TaxID=2812559 RepID=UPI001A9704B9|nr:DUF3578 domain-containing protein [Arenibaculum pallidiluteum]